MHPANGFKILDTEFFDLHGGLPVFCKVTGSDVPSLKVRRNALLKVYHITEESSCAILSEYLVI
jgi:hypothetical protein